MTTYKRTRSHRDVEDLLAERGIAVSQESIRLWCIKFGPKYARWLKRKHQGYGDTSYIDEVFVKINGKQHYLWQALGICQSLSKPQDRCVFRVGWGGSMSLHDLLLLDPDT